MPVKAEQRGGKWRVVEINTGNIAKNKGGTPVDGGGHPSENGAKRQAAAVNTNETFDKKFKKRKPYE